MDMTLPEQLVWAAVYAAEFTAGSKERNSTIMQEELAMEYATKATRAVILMRDAHNCARQNDGLRQRMGNTAFDHLRQMTFDVRGGLDGDRR